MLLPQNLAERELPDIPPKPMAITRQFEKLMAPSSDEVSAPSVPSSWSSKSPSVPDSASQMAAEILVLKAQQLNEVNAKLEKYRERLEALEAQRKRPYKRERNIVDEDLAAEPIAPDELPPPTKKPSPEPSPELPQTKPKTKAKQKPARDASPSSESEMAPPSPDQDSASSEVTPQPYEGLNSIVCACKQEGGFRPGKDGLTYDFCAELVEEEILAVADWDRAQKVRSLPMILSALKLIFPSEKGDWSSRIFASSPSGAARYWCKVLKQYKNLWLKRAKKEKELVKSPSTMASVTSRIRSKIANSTRSKARQLFSQKEASSSSKHEPIVISDSDSDGPIPVGGEDAAASKSQSKLAPAPESYTRAEMKAFARMARAIRNTSDGAHVTATANFLDAEFSDNSGKAARVLSSQFAWKRNRFKEIAAKAAKILEDR